MSESRVAVRLPSTDRVLESVADATRRDVLAVLLGESDPVSVRELATAVAALQNGQPFADVTHADRKPIAVALVHVHLPKLASSSLLEWAPGEDVVATLERAALDDRHLREILSVDADDWDVVLGALADGRRRLALSILEGTDEAVDRATLARRVAARELDVPPARVPDGSVRNARTELRHTHLPTLRGAGLVSDDGESVSYVGHADLRTEWLSLDPDVGGRPDSQSGGVDGGSVDDGEPGMDPRGRTADEAED